MDVFSKGQGIEEFLVGGRPLLEKKSMGKDNLIFSFTLQF